MRSKQIVTWLGVTLSITLINTACKTPALVTKTENRTVPAAYVNTTDTARTNGPVAWSEFFTDPNLDTLIATALRNNQELNITTQEIAITRNEIQARQGEYLPFVGLRGEAGLDRPGRYTLQGATEEAVTIKERRTPDPLPNFLVGAFASWEVDIWRRLRNAKQAAVLRYQSSTEGRNFMITNLVGEIATSYYELLAYDNQLSILKENIDIQNNALRIVRLQKESARVTELAVRRFEAQVLHTREMQYSVQQRIVETENRINFLVGRYPQPVVRNSQSFVTLTPAVVRAGVPSQLLANRPDIKRAELDLAAAKLDVQVARANFYPRLDITAGAGFEAFNPMFLLSTPQSILYSLAGGLTAPLVNRLGIKSAYSSANARQTQAVYNYERTILNAYVEVANQLANISNLENSYNLKTQEVTALTQSTDIANTLFGNARADYMEVLLTQRDALEARFDLVETKMQQINATVNIYRALGGGWK
ncbi:TolC family protein [Spirosoma sp. KUDC1026]|uniref:TolC family protein n=1 Tax=Spirosoma sp. KUDC1026 TaxID=2745947 RepID=UPI00159BE29C|nr:TolC family protein [Spirosoma sp. KUDC1026]QKZ15055.1 TolC family protein [Spirosoma sp. KUDC1026]